MPAFLLAVEAWVIARILWPAPGTPQFRREILHSPEGSGAPADAGVCETPGEQRARLLGGTLCEGVPSLLSERGASRRSTPGQACAVRAFSAAFSLRPFDPRFRAVTGPYLGPNPERWPPLLRLCRVQPIAPWSCGQPVIMPAGGRPGPPERRLCVSLPAGAASTDGRGCPRSPTRWSRQAESPASRPTAAPASQRPMTAPLASRTGER